MLPSFSICIAVGDAYYASVCLFGEMHKTVAAFLVLLVVYHILHTGLVFGLGRDVGFEIALVRDLLWLGLIGSILLQKHTLRDLPGAWWRAGAGLVVLFGWSLALSTVVDSSIMSIIVGIKYDLAPLVILFLSCLAGWALWKDNDNLSAIAADWKRYCYWLCWLIVGGGLLWQLGKIVLPELFFSFGYGPIGDYLLGSSPPLYYRTGPDGLMRLQGLFAGPNNYGYWLVAFAGFFLSLFVDRKEHESLQGRLLLVMLTVVSLFRTFSRGALVGVAVTIAVIIWVWWPQVRKWIWSLLGLVLVGGIGLSLLKSGSTVGHWTARQEGMQAFFANPRGYGLGSAGPSIHFEGTYLPENHYLQLLLDIGIPGLLIWLFTLGAILGPIAYRSRGKQSAAARLVFVLLAGLGGLLVEGLFLHTFEDSMVVYLIALPLGLLGGYWLHALKSS